MGGIQSEGAEEPEQCMLACAVERHSRATGEGRDGADENDAAVRAGRGGAEMVQGEPCGEDGALEVDVERSKVRLGGVEVCRKRGRSCKVAEFADAGIGDDDVQYLVGGEGEGTPEEGLLRGVAGHVDREAVKAGRILEGPEKGD